MFQLPLNTVCPPNPRTSVRPYWRYHQMSLRPWTFHSGQSSINIPLTIWVFYSVISISNYQSNDSLNPKCPWQILVKIIILDFTNKHPPRSQTQVLLVLPVKTLFSQPWPSLSSPRHSLQRLLSLWGRFLKGSFPHGLGMNWSLTWHDFEQLIDCKKIIHLTLTCRKLSLEWFIQCFGITFSFVYKSNCTTWFCSEWYLNDIYIILII